MDEYIETIKKILGEDNFKKLSNQLYAEVNKKYRNINIEDATEIVEFNLANILVIGVEIARGCDKKEITKLLSWYNLGPKSHLLQKSLNGFEENYSKYINIIINKVKENESNI